MNIALGLKAHSGWAVLVALGVSGRGVQVLDRRRMELVAPGTEPWAKQPYHAAEGLPPQEARRLVDRGVAAAHRVAESELLKAVAWAQEVGHDLAACAVLTPSPMPPWTTEQILSVHIRMHKAEGSLFPAALARAATEAGLRALLVPERELEARAAAALALEPAEVMDRLASLGRSMGPPWGRDHKAAALAAMMALRDRG